MTSSLERIDPQEIASVSPETVALHLERYRFAGQHLAAGAIADVACGVGYGSYLLATEFSDKISTIVAIDNDSDSINVAKEKYALACIKYVCADALQFQSPIQFNTVISLETIEHLPDPTAFIKNIAIQLQTGGRFITSVPITPSVDINPYHLHDFSKSAFIDFVVSNGFTLKTFYIQKQAYSLGLIKQKKFRGAAFRQNILSFYLRHPLKLLLRITSLITDGLCNKYLVCVFEKT